MGSSGWKRAGFVLGPCLLTLAFACGEKSSPVAPSTSSVPLPGLDEMLADKVLGDPAAPVTITEYSSLACPHCASFHAATLPQIKTAYLDTGKARLIYRDFPIGTAATSAAMVARCSGNSYFAVIDLLYRTQVSWASAGDTSSALKKVVADAGLSAALVDTCLASADLRSGIQNIRSNGATQYGIDATPTFIFNGQQILEGAWPFGKFDEILKQLTS